MRYTTILIAVSFLLTECSKTYHMETFGNDLKFLKKYNEVVLLKNNNDRCQLIVVPEYQGRVMTSTSDGLDGRSYGWLNYGLISSGEIEEHINVFGGEDRLWFGPEGGQFSIFFEKGMDFEFENWFTPKAIDTEAFDLISKSDNEAVFGKQIQLTNYQGFEFEIDVRRVVSLLDLDAIQQNLDIEFGEDVSYVGFQSDNVIKNIGDDDWSKENGLLSIWILGMLKPSNATTILLPYKDSLNLNTGYFGKVGPDRLKVVGNTVLFKGDGKFRAKIGLPKENALPVVGSYDSENHILTIVECTIEENLQYVNSLWEIQDNPFEGDVINAYNDGPLENGEQLGPFYELESSSAAKELKKNERIRHIQKTYHFEGSHESLNIISKRTLGFDLDDIYF